MTAAPSAAAVPVATTVTGTTNFFPILAKPFIAEDIPLAVLLTAVIVALKAFWVNVFKATLIGDNLLVIMSFNNTAGLATVFESHFVSVLILLAFEVKLSLILTIGETTLFFRPSNNLFVDFSFDNA